MPWAYDATKATPKFDIHKIIGSDIDKVARTLLPRAPPRPDIRLRPTTGRTVFVRNKGEIGPAVATVNRMAKRNGLAQMERAQRYHERPGLRRKRLKSQRWRDRFKKGFVATVQRVQELTKQGW
jgi:ribosomal protein S21